MSRPQLSKSFILNKAPYAEVNLKLGEKDSTFKLVENPLRELEDGEVLIRTLILSNDPTQRAWIQKGVDPNRMYVEPVYEGQVMRSSGLGEVVESKNPSYQVGDILNCYLKWSDYTILKKESILNKIPKSGLPPPMYLDVLGLTGLTAYFGLFDVAKLKKSDTIVISAASGATGSMCVQIAKKVVGCKRVIGISGGKDKCKFVESIGADVCVDYKDPDFAKNIKKALGTENYCDVFFDGVGGRILDIMLTLVKPFGTVVACGAIAGYNDFKKSMIANWPQIIVNRLSVKGFIIIDYSDRYAEGVTKIASWIKQGKIKVDKNSFTMIDLSDAKNFAKIPEAWSLLFSNGKGPGKLLTKVSDYKL